MDAFITVVVFVAVFSVIFLNLADRVYVVLSGAAVLVMVGMASGFYPLDHIIKSIYFETLTLIFGMSIISSILAKSKLFDSIAGRVASHSQGDISWTMIILILVTYTLSLLVNNLSAMVIILPITINICRQLKINPVPILISEVVASNLGGASTMIGDFPNMIISSAGKLHFHDFISGMMVPALILLAITIVYFDFNKPVIDHKIEDEPSDTEDNSNIQIDSYLKQLGLTLLGATLIAFLIAGSVDIRPGWVALIVGILGLTLGRFKSQELFKSSGSKDILFFTGLFILVGGLEAAGVLNSFSWFITSFADGSYLFTILLLMWVAGVTTIFLNAGPATAFFIPVAIEIHAAVPDNAVWWALSLGILAGSSASLTGATAGSLAVTHLENSLPKYKGSLNFKSYWKHGLPLMGIFLLVSTLYISIIST